jgi:hypothetical protein
MEKNYRGDTFFRSYSIELGNELYKFQNGDKIKLAFCTNINDRYLEKEIILTTDETEANVSWSAKDMATLPVGLYILEAEVTTQDFTKTHQEQIKIDEDFIYGDE